jgi:hypothetical protein
MIRQTTIVMALFRPFPICAFPEEFWEPIARRFSFKRRAVDAATRLVQSQSLTGP